MVLLLCLTMLCHYSLYSLLLWLYDDVLLGLCELPRGSVTLCYDGSVTLCYIGSVCDFNVTPALNLDTIALGLCITMAMTPCYRG
jgi:hypothetical protein